MKTFIGTMILLAALYMMGSNGIFQKKNPPSVQLNDSIICPDAVTVCLSNTTCCAAYDGAYVCCRFNPGICCGEKRPCCPLDTKCNQTTSSCDKK